jgi:hypothetical protein
MSLLDKASLIVTPNAYKESKLYSVIPTSGAGDMTVVRATTATRKNSAGFIEDVPYNLLRSSEQFDSANWAKVAASVTANATTAPNGTLTADKLIEDSTNNQHRADQTSISTIGTNTFSVYAKKSERDVLWLRVGTSGAYFDLTNGTISGASGVTASIVSLANGWYRCIIIRVSTVANEVVRLNLAIGINGTYLGNGTSGIFIWGAQLNTGSTVKDYFLTTDRFNIARIDYSNGTCPSLLVEPQRTNLVPISNGATANFFNGVVVLNAATSPQGINNAFSFDVNNGQQGGQAFVTLLTTAQSYTFSVYLKGSVNGQKVRLFSDINGSIQDFTLTTDWARYTKTFTGAVGAQSFYLLNGSYFSPAQNDLYYGYGLQLEVGAYASSLIPTNGAAVTRNADVISKTGISSLIGQTEGTAFIECTADTTNSNGAMLIYLGSSDGSGAFNYSTYLKFSSTSLNLTVYSGGTSYVDSTSSQTYTNKQNIKVAFAYKNNDFVCYANGVQLFTDTTGVVSTNLSSLSLGHYPPNIPFNQYNGNIKSAQIYKTRLSNTELAQLTTI